MRCSKVLAPVDLSAHAHPAVRLASSLARHDHGALTLLFVDQLPEFAEAMALHASGEVVESYLHDRTALLTHALDELGGTLGGGSVQTAVARDDVAVAIVDRALHDGSDLVVLDAPSHQKRLGHVIAEVAARAPCPVLVVRESASHPKAEEPFRRPLIVASLRHPVEAALSLAQAISRPDARIEVVFVDEERSPYEIVDADRLREEFAEAARPLQARGVSTSLLWSEGANVVDLLLGRIESEGQDVVIVEKKAPGAQSAMETVARKLLDRAPLPLAIVATG
ncbi:MAG: universal stress protein [Polyangiales bacterium]